MCPDHFVCGSWKIAAFSEHELEIGGWLTEGFEYPNSTVGEVVNVYIAAQRVWLKNSRSLTKWQAWVGLSCIQPTAFPRVLFLQIWPTPKTMVKCQTTVLLEWLAKVWWTPEIGSVTFKLFDMFRSFNRCRWVPSTWSHEHVLPTTFSPKVPKGLSLKYFFGRRKPILASNPHGLRFSYTDSLDPGMNSCLIYTFYTNSEFQSWFNTTLLQLKTSWMARPKDEPLRRGLAHCEDSRHASMWKEVSWGLFRLRNRRFIDLVQKKQLSTEATSMWWNPISNQTIWITLPLCDL